MKIKFMPMDITIEGDPNKSILQLAWANKIEIKSICKGIPSCSECRINIKEGENCISPPTKDELNLIGTSYFLDGRRLACQVRCYGDVVIDMTEQVGRTDGQAKKIRGYRVQKGQETTAINDNLILDTKADVSVGGASEPADYDPGADSTEDKPQGDSRQRQGGDRNGNRDGQGQRNARGGGRGNGAQGEGGGANRNAPNRGGGQQGGGQNQGQRQGQNQNRNNNNRGGNRNQPNAGGVQQGPRTEGQGGGQPRQQQAPKAPIVQANTGYQPKPKSDGNSSGDPKKD